MKTRSKNLIAIFAAVAAGCAISPVSQASPYASSVTNVAGTVSFILNESADNVKVIYGSATNNLGALPAGLHSSGPGVTDPVRIEVTKNSGPGWKTPSGSNLVHTVGTNTSVTTPWAGRIWISDSNNILTRFPTPRGLAVNRDPASPFFGRVYVANTSPGTTAGRSVGRGLYTMNADLSDSPNAYGDTAQQSATFSSSGSSAPYQLSMGADGNIYIADFSDANGNVFRVDGDLVNIERVFDYNGGPSTVLGPTNHGSIKRVRTTGSLAAGNLKVYTIDEDFTNSVPPILTTAKGSILRYDIDSGPLTNQNLPVLAATPTPSWTVTTFQDFDIGTNGYLYVIHNRSAGVEPGLYVIDAATGAAITNSRSMWREISGNATNVDILMNLHSIAVSPDCKYLAINLLSSSIPTGSDCWIIPLADGIPDLANRMVLDSGQVIQGRGVDFDAAGNLYTISSGDAQLRVWSPGGSTTITTGNDGSFNISTPPTTVTLAAAVTNANEAGPVNPVFTVTRSGGLATSLTVNYTLGGTATAGSDYTTLPGSVTFAAGVSSTNVTVVVTDDSDTEPTETVVMDLAIGAGYGIGSPASASATILDNETAEISISGVVADGAQTNLLEGFADSKAVFVLSRKGSLGAPTTVNLTYSGVASAGGDYSSPATVTFAANAVTTNVVLTSINDPAMEVPESFTVTIASGSYNLGTPVAASGLVYSEDLAPGTALFSDPFDSDTSANWAINKSTEAEADSDAVFGFDYSAVGIPEAPNSTGGFTATSGLRLRAHIGPASITPGISVSPLNGNFTGDYRFRFDAWINYVGPLDVGGAGSTEHASYGVGTSGTVPIWPGGGFSDCIWFTTASDGDVGETSANQADYGVFIGPGLQPVGTGYYLAGTNAASRGNSDPYYGAFGGSVAPAAQTNLFPAQVGTVRGGAMGMAWHSVVLTKSGDEVSWDVDGYRIATVTNVAANITLAGNVFLGFHDWFSSTNADPTTTFALYDNVRVESFETPLMITGIQIINGGADVQINFTASSSAVSGDFELHKSGTVDGTYANDAGALITGAAGSFQAVTAVSPGQQFYRIKKP